MYDTPEVYTWKDPSAAPHLPALQCHFVVRPEVNAQVTAEMGIQTYDNVTDIFVYPAGMPKSNVAYEVERVLPNGEVKTTRHTMKYAAPFKLHKAGIASEATGTPLKDLVGMTPATIMTLKSLGVHTIEVLATLQDAVGHNLMGFWELRDKAKKHLELREKNAPMLKIEAIEAAHKQEVDSLKRQLADLAAAVAEKRGPGRPRKADTEQEAA